MKLNLNIDANNIENSFDRMAIDLFRNWALFVNNKKILFTEIEFYYFHDNHKDEYTHPHKRDVGEWRFHNQGLDITFQGDEKSDGGILIRGIYVDGKYINGPRLVIGEIFTQMGSVNELNQVQLKRISPIHNDVIKTFRHLPNKINYPEFHDKQYRYIADLETLPLKESEKVIIRSKSVIV